jgi:hypothetical protein
VDIDDAIEQWQLDEASCLGSTLGEEVHAKACQAVFQVGACCL